MRIRTLLSVSAAVLAGALGLSAPAFAADGDTARLIALTAHDPTLYGTSYQVKPGETVPVEAGVANLGDKPVGGLVVHFWFIGSEQRLTDDFSNCQYYLDGTEQGAWCEFDQELAAGRKYSLPPLHVSVPEGAKETRTLVEVVYSKEYADSRGGMAALAKADSSPGSLTLVPGTGAKASLVEGTDLTPSKEPTATSFIYFNLILPSASPPASPKPTASSTSTATVAPTAGAQGGGTGGGGLPVTGSNTAVMAGVGTALLVGGVAVFLLARRRRARFTA